MLHFGQLVALGAAASGGEGGELFGGCTLRPAHGFGGTPARTAPMKATMLAVREACYLFTPVLG